MFANIKKIEKPIQKQDFYLPTGEPVPPDRRFNPFRSHTRSFNKFKLIPIWRAEELAADGWLLLRRRIELKAELQKRFKKDKKVCSQTWHLASILERDITNAEKCQSFWNKIEDKLKTFELSEIEQAAIRGKIEAVIPRPNKA